VKKHKKRYLEANHGYEKETRLCGLFRVGVLDGFKNK
tara:strand:+ start:131 stop:241 length:111 start_codon:yes stop_codon:yes gene_type:complete